MRTTRAFVIIQMRDETYERYKNQPPLDTYRTGVVFHISPPRFVDVVKRRLELSIEYLTSAEDHDRYYELETGLRIRYSNSDLQEFLKRLYNAIFDRRRNISRVLEAVAGKDVRKALEIIVAIITSGYLSTLAIASNTMGAGEVALKEHTILRILMRTNRRLFSNDSGFVQNIFAYDATSEKPDNFIVIEILFFLFSNRKISGSLTLRGILPANRWQTRCKSSAMFLMTCFLLSAIWSDSSHHHRPLEHERGPMGRLCAHLGRRVGSPAHSHRTF